jgi:hypothetical protein
MSDAVMVECFLCGQRFQFGPQRYDGRRFPKLDITVCRACEVGNWDGLTSRHDAKLREHLGEDKWKIVDRSRNAKGWIPLE